MRAAAFVDRHGISDTSVSQPDNRLFILSDHMDDHAHNTCSDFCAGSAESFGPPSKINFKKTIYDPLPEYEFCKMEQYNRYRCFANFVLG